MQGFTSPSIGKFKNAVNLNVSRDGREISFELIFLSPDSVFDCFGVDLLIYHQKVKMCKSIRIIFNKYYV